MGRLIEFLFFLFLLYMLHRRLAMPFRRGFDARERERQEHSRMKRKQSSEVFTERRRQSEEGNGGRIDRRQVEDAEFEDLDDRNKRP